MDMAESKDGKFQVQDGKNRVVANVDAHGSVQKHLEVLRQANGDQHINGFKTGAAEVNLDQDVPSVHSRLGAKGPVKHVHAHVVQMHDSHGFVDIAEVRRRPQPRPAPQQYQAQPMRFRREVPMGQPCSELGCLNLEQ